MGTIRLAFAFGSGLVGILYLFIAISSLAMGGIEIRPTSLSIDTVESKGFPEAEYLEVTDGYIVFSIAEAMMHSETSKEQGLFRLTAPLVSKSLLKTWQASLEKGEPVDAAKLRLLVSFNAEQVGRLWPKLKEQAEAGQPLKQPPVKMSLTGDTELAKHMVFKPYELKRSLKNFEWEQAHWLRFERHFDSLGRLLKNLAIGLGLLALSVVVFREHFRRPSDAAQNVFDWSALPHGDDASGVDDIDLDV